MREFRVIILWSMIRFKGIHSRTENSIHLCSIRYLMSVYIPHCLIIPYHCEGIPDRNSHSQSWIISWIMVWFRESKPEWTVDPYVECRFHLSDLFFCINQIPWCTFVVNDNSWSRSRIIYFPFISFNHTSLWSCRARIQCWGNLELTCPEHLLLSAYECSWLGLLVELRYSRRFSFLFLLRNSYSFTVMILLSTYFLLFSLFLGILFFCYPMLFDKTILNLELNTRGPQPSCIPLNLCFFIVNILFKFHIYFLRRRQSGDHPEVL